MIIATRNTDLFNEAEADDHEIPGRHVDDATSAQISEVITNADDFLALRNDLIKHHRRRKEFSPRVQYPGVGYPVVH